MEVLTIIYTLSIIHLHPDDTEDESEYPQPAWVHSGLLFPRQVGQLDIRERSHQDDASGTLKTSLCSV